MEMIQNQNIDVLFLFYKNMPVWAINSCSFITATSLVNSVWTRKHPKMMKHFS